MKKTICIIISSILVLTLIGCSHLTEEAKGIAENAVEVTEQYLQGAINIDDAALKLKYYDEQADSIIPDLEDRDQLYATFALQTYVHLLYIDLYSHDTEDKIKEHLHELKALL